MNFDDFDAAMRVSHRSVVSLLEEALASNSVVESKRLSAQLRSTLNDMIATRNPSSPAAQVPGTRKLLVGYGNAALGVMGRILADDLDNWPRARKTLDRHVVDILKLAEEQLEENPSEDESGEEDAALLIKWRLNARHLRAELLQRGMAYGEAPIITRFPFDRNKLRRASLPFEVFAGYTVLTRQKVFGVSHAFIEDQYDIENEAKPGKRNIPESVKVDIVKSALDLFLMRNPSLVALGETAHPWEGGRWFWVMQRNMLPILRSCGLGSSTAGGLGVWGFGFESKDQIKHLGG